MLKILTLLSLIITQQSILADIFGKDDRIDIHQAGRRSTFGKSGAVGVLNSLWEEVNSNFSELWADPISDFMCSDEKFYRQKNISYACTGFLVSEDLLVTAGHCGVNIGEVRNSSDNYCEAYTWLFDYTAATNSKRVSKKNIYTCKEIIYAVQQEEDGFTHDFALIRLDRKVEGRKPLKLANQKLKKNDDVYMIGHPMGLPMKYTPNAHVFDDNVGRSYFTNLDAFGGNSGSPVFNDDDEVIGVLIAGNPGLATYKDPEAGCDRYNRCDEDGKNCKALQPNSEEGFPNVFSEVQSIEFYKDLILENL